LDLSRRKETIGFPSISVLVSIFQMAAGGSSHWYLSEYEYNYIEAVLVIVFVIINIIFAFVWHGLVHLGQDTYSYGCTEKDSHGNIKHRQLHLEHINRIGSEFMALGLLALLIFIVNQSGGLDSLAHTVPAESPMGFITHQRITTGCTWLKSFTLGCSWLFQFTSA